MSSQKNTDNKLQETIDKVLQDLKYRHNFGNEQKVAINQLIKKIKHQVGNK